MQPQKEERFNLGTVDDKYMSRIKHVIFVVVLSFFPGGYESLMEYTSKALMLFLYIAELEKALYD